MRNGFCGLAGDVEFEQLLHLGTKFAQGFLCTLAGRHVVHACKHEIAAERAQADLDRNLSAVLAQTGKDLRLAHGARPRAPQIFLVMHGVGRAESFGYRIFDRQPEHLGLRVAEECCGRWIGQNNAPRFVGDQHGVNRCVEQA